MKLKELSTVFKEAPIVSGFDNINSVAEYLVDERHGYMLNGYLLFAYKGTGPIKSVVFTSGSDYGLLRLSEVYDSYKMSYNSFDYNHDMDKYIEELNNDKKLVSLKELLVKRFYED